MSWESRESITQKQGIVSCTSVALCFSILYHPILISFNFYWKQYVFVGLRDLCLKIWGVLSAFVVDRDSVWSPGAYIYSIGRLFSIGSRLSFPSLTIASSRPSTARPPSPMTSQSWQYILACLRASLVHLPVRIIRLFQRLVLHLWSLFSRRLTRRDPPTAPKPSPPRIFQTICSENDVIAGYMSFPASRVPQSIGEALTAQPSGSSSSPTPAFTRPSTPRTITETGNTARSHATGAGTQHTTLTHTRPRTVSLTSLRARRGPQSRVGAAPTQITSERPSRPVSLQIGSANTSVQARPSVSSIRSGLSVNIIPPNVRPVTQSICAPVLEVLSFFFFLLDTPAHENARRCRRPVYTR
jgi:hypothetical protein